MTTPKKPQDCSSMEEVRLGIDALDKTLVELLKERAGYIDRATELKQGNGWPARIPERVEEVVNNARRVAETEGLDPDLVEQLWRQLIDWSITREETGLGRK
ncbi:chorismate mutase [Cognatishimia activa]|uniref:chorismate mutase n=1 Tax=Cognatishimia activa TaxID=1715691 RepID=A0A0P1ISK1_9RHOB|nr:chorismate mutase [Cognatishimia activa]MEE2944169.1 chorismate mutase [Pseudomonadota bacterium]CUI69911.1 Salicylate biosynthesis protein PchB [Cognatishimia activa]CUK26548.1 Salicylate biosynthesis protein PchB [Cognatishimia activa]